MSLPTALLVQTDAGINFRGITLRGDILHVPENHLLALASMEQEEVLTIEAPESPLARAEAASFAGVHPQQLVTIKDYSEHAGLTRALERMGLVQVLGRFTTGPFASPVVVAEVCVS